MGRTMSVEEKIRRAEEIYARRQEGTQKRTATVKVNNEKRGILHLVCLFFGCIIFRTDNVKFFCITVLLLFSPFLRQNKRDGPQRQSN